VVAERTGISRDANEDVTAKNIRRRGERIRRMFNVYDQKNTHSGERQAPELTYKRVIRHGSTGLAADFDAHSIRWDPWCQVQQNAGFWENVINENSLEIGNNDEATHYWTRDSHECESFIDLTLAN